MSLVWGGLVDGAILVETTSFFLIAGDRPKLSVGRRTQRLETSLVITRNLLIGFCCLSHIVMTVNKVIQSLFVPAQPLEQLFIGVVTLASQFFQYEIDPLFRILEVFSFALQCILTNVALACLSTPFLSISFLGLRVV